MESVLLKFFQSQASSPSFINGVTSFFSYGGRSGNSATLQPPPKETLSQPVVPSASKVAMPPSTMAANLSPPASSKEKGKKKKKKEKSSGKETAFVPPELLVVESTITLIKDGFLKAPEPSIETSELWKSQVLLPFKVDNTLHAFLGPITTREELDSILNSFPSTVEYLPLVFCKDVRMDYFKARVFRTGPQQEARALFAKWKARLRPVYSKYRSKPILTKPYN
ncbi:hypothetical protein PIB30_051629 [Stylosanthes scabra]|uniref:Uncharacterized protein n=1 Tax=Stylosanthes scabra TaxID=79078 RepID=A0ABU6TK01_9FABA|nr:hypothetical protein [Stylosanthes scabra]